MDRSLVHRMWVSNDGNLWHWFCEGLNHDPRGPARCGAEPDPTVSWHGKKPGQWMHRLTSNRPANVCEGCVIAKKRDDLRGRRYVIFVDGRALLGLRIRCGTCLMASSSPDDVIHRYCGNCHAYHDRYANDLPEGVTDEYATRAYQALGGSPEGA